MSILLYIIVYFSIVIDFQRKSWKYKIFQSLNENVRIKINIVYIHLLKFLLLVLKAD